MDYFKLIEDIKNDIILISLKKKEIIQAYETCDCHKYQSVFDNLLTFLDYFALETSYEIKINFDGDRIKVYTSEGNLTIKELYDFLCADKSIFNTWVNQYSGDDLAWGTYILGQELYKTSRRTTNSHLSYLRYIVKSFDAIDIRVDDNICSFTFSDRDEESLKGLIPTIASANDDEPRYFMTLYPRDIDVLRTEFIKWSENPLCLKYLNTPKVVIKSNINIYSNRFKDIIKSAINPTVTLKGIKSNNIAYTHIKQGYREEYWAILDAGTINIPIITSKNIAVDVNTPFIHRNIRSITGKFAIELTKSKYSDDYRISRSQKGQHLYQDKAQSVDLYLPVQCNFPFIKEELSDNILLSSTFNRWIISIWPKLYFNLLKEIPQSLLQDTSILPYLIPDSGIDIIKVYNYSIQNCEVQFLPYYSNEYKRTSEWLRIKDSFVNHTRICGYDRLISDFLSKKYNNQYVGLKGIFLKEDIDLSRVGVPTFEIEDILELLSDKDMLTKLRVEEYAQLFYQVYLTYSTLRNWDSEVNNLRHLQCLIDSEGKYVFPKELICASVIKCIKPYCLLNESFVPFLYKQAEKSISFKGFLEELGVGEIVSKVMDGTLYMIHIDNYKRCVYIVDERLNHITHLNISIDSLPDETICGFVDGNSSCYYKYVYESCTQLSHSRFKKVGLVCDGIKYSTAILDTTGKIIVPFGWKRGKCIIDEVNSRILYVSILNQGYNNDIVDYILTNDCIFSFDGERLFPNKYCQHDKVSIIHNSKLGACIGVDNEGSFYIIKKDYVVLPFETQIGKNEESHLKYSYTFEFLTTEFIRATHHTGYDPVSIILDHNGKKLLYAYGKCEYDSKLNKFILYNRHHNATSIYDKTGTYFCDIVDSRDVNYCKDNIRVNGEVIKVKKSYKFADANREYYGLLDKQLNIVFPIICESISKLYDNGPYRININGKYGLLDQGGTLTIPPCHDFISGSFKWVHGVCKYLLYTIKDFTIADDQRGKKIIKGGTRRIIDIHGNELIEGVDFDYVRYLDNYSGNLIVAKHTRNPEIEEQDGKVGILDADLNVIIPFEYDFIKLNNKIFLLNKGGYFDDTIKRISGGKWGFKCGDAVIDCVYDSIEIYHDRYVSVGLNNKHSLLDISGNVVIPFEFDNVFMPIVNMARVNNDGKWYFYNTAKQMVDSPALDFEHVGDVVNGYAIYIQDGKYGYLNDKYEIYLTNMFEYAENFNHAGIAKVILDGKRILIDKLANEVGVWQEMHQSFKEDFSYQDDVLNWEEETWYHLTGGQYGDCPEGDIDYDFLGL